MLASIYIFSTGKLKPRNIDLSSALFDWDKTSEYIFEIRSQNNMGYSVNASYIRVPAILDERKIKYYTPISINNVYHAKNRTYMLKWSLRALERYETSSSIEDNDYPMSYTVYWCKSKRVLQNVCEGTIHFDEIPAIRKIYYTESQSEKQEHTLNLAVSANFKNINTGMHWAPCTLDAENDLKEMKPDLRNISDSVIEVQWNSEHVCPAILSGFNLTYCEVAWPSNVPQNLQINNMLNMTDINTTDIHCNNPANITITDQNAIRTNIENLKPYTIYRIAMKMFSSKKVGKLSDYMYVRTRESASTPPRELEVSHVKNTTAIISWIPPEIFNGYINYYVVYLNNTEHKIHLTDDMRNSHLHGNLRIKYKLENLLCNKYYEIYLTAYTVANSIPSNYQYFTTRIGYPQQPNTVDTRVINKITYVEWSKPKLKNGNIDFYEVSVTESLYDKIIRKHISIINGTSCTMNTLPCNNNEYQTKIKVRAVNIANISDSDSDNTTFYDNTLYDNTLISYYTDYYELKCVDNINSAQNILDKYSKPTKFYRFYRSAWNSDYGYKCAIGSLATTIFALFMVISTLGVMMAIYLAKKKYGELADIKCTFPPGLDFYKTKDSAFSSNTNDFDARYNINNYNNATNTTSIDTLPINCNSDMHNFHNEKRHLLESICNDSSYLDDAAAIAAVDALASHSIDDGRKNSQIPSIPSDYVRTNSECSSGSLVNSNASTVEVEPCEINLNVSMMPTSSSYIKAEKLNDFCNDGGSGGRFITQCYNKNQDEENDNDDDDDNEEQTEQNNKINLNNCGDYVAVESIKKTPTFAGNGNIPIQAARTTITPPTTTRTNKPKTNVCDYTTLEQISYMSGYVTPGELNVLGKQQQLQQHQHRFE